MQRLADNKVHLSKSESEITDLFLQLVAEENMALPEAALHALSALPNPDPQFVDWLGHVEPKTN